MTTAAVSLPPEDDPVIAYKRLLKEYLDRRPSGTRQRLARALGTHKSFISQVTNPNYRVPLPAQHVETIFRICHFSPEEQRAFLAAYRAAHAAQAVDLGSAAAGQSAYLTLAVPPMGSPARQQAVIDTIRELAERIIALAQDGGATGRADINRDQEPTRADSAPPTRREDDP